MQWTLLSILSNSDLRERTTMHAVQNKLLNITVDPLWENYQKSTFGSKLHSTKNPSHTAV